MATRTIANGGGNWSATATWVEAAVPTSADDVVATGTSGALTIDVAAACRSIDLTGYTSTLTHASGITLSVGDASGGVLKFVAGMTYTLGNANSSAVAFVSTSNNGGTGWAITTAGKTFGNVSFNGVGGKWVLQDTFGISNSAISIANGTLDTNNQTINAGNISLGGSTGTRVFTMGSSAINLNGGGFAFDMWNATGLTITANTAVMTFTNGFFRSQTANIDYNGLSLVHTGVGNQTLDASGCTFRNITWTGGAAASHSLSIANPFTVTDTFTVTGANSTTQRLAVKSTVGGTARTITVNGYIRERNVDYTDITKAGTATWPTIPNSDLKVWFKADDKLWQDSARTTVATADGNPVGAWDDASGTLNHALQATAGKRPLYKTSILNGKPVLRFDGTDDDLKNAFVSGFTQPSTFLFVGSATNTGWYLFDGASGSRHAFGHNLLGNAANCDLYAGTGISITQAATMGATIWLGLFNTTSSRLRRGSDGVEVTGNAGSNSMGGITIGNHFGEIVGPLQGDVAEIVGYNALLTDSQIDQVGNYLATKYALTWTNIVPSFVAPSFRARTVAVRRASVI